MAENLSSVFIPINKQFEGIRGCLCHVFHCILIHIDIIHLHLHLIFTSASDAERVPERTSAEGFLIKTSELFGYENNSKHATRC